MRTAGQISGWVWIRPSPKFSTTTLSPIVSPLFSRIKQLIKKEQARLTRPAKVDAHPTTRRPSTRPPRPLQFSTTTPSPIVSPLPQPITPDYDYNEDYYYYDEAGINSGEPISDVNIKHVDQDYDRDFYSYYSDDGEEPEYMDFLQVCM